MSSEGTDDRRRDLDDALTRGDAWRDKFDADTDELVALRDRVAELEAEVDRHHRDFERWEAMADKGAQQIADATIGRWVRETAAMPDTSRSSWTPGYRAALADALAATQEPT
jgi:transposase